MINYSQPDLTQFPPRSARVRLGDFAHLPRLLDKARAEIAGKIGEFHYNCPMDQQFFRFTGISAEAFLAAVKAGGSDSDLLAWVMANTTRLPYEIGAWSDWLATNGPGGVGGHEFLAGTIKGLAAGRQDIRNFFDMLDLDDYVTYGGKG
jgi:hypothetical protein